MLGGNICMFNIGFSEPNLCLALVLGPGLMFQKPMYPTYPCRTYPKKFHYRDSWI